MYVSPQIGKMEGKILESIMMGGIWVMVSGSMFYENTVVCGDVNLIDAIYGGRTSLFLTSQRMPAATDAYTRLYNNVNIYTPSVASGSGMIHLKWTV